MIGGGGGAGNMRLDEYDVDLKSVNPQVWRQLGALIRPYTGRLLLSTLLMMVTAAAGLVGPSLVQIAIDSFIQTGDEAGLNLAAAAFLGAALISWATSYSQTYLISLVGQRIVYDMRDRMVRHLQKLSFRFYDAMATGRIVSRVMSDVDSINQLVSAGLVSVLADGMSLLFIMGRMLTMNVRLALVSFVTIPILLGVLQLFKRQMRVTFAEQRRQAANMNANLAESIAGMRVTQSFTREEQNHDQFNQINERTRKANLAAIAIWARFLPSIELVAAFGTTLLLWYGGVLIKGGATGVTVGQVAAFILFLGRFFGPIRDLSQVFNIVQAAVISAERVGEVLSQEPEVTDLPTAYALPRLTGAVEFRNVIFGYDETQPILKGINLHVQPGQTIALVGPTGAGKSSIINLLSRFYDPQGGAVLVDGHDLRDVTQDSLRGQLGTVLQEPFLFTGTIRQNIRFGRPDATDAEVEEAAKAVGAHEWILKLPQGYETGVNERGARLSVGQRQLIAFARALVADPAILILDEATSNIDTYTESIIQRALGTLLEGRTAFVIAHRLSTIQNADCIYVVDGGQIVEQGTHAELLALGGRYASLHQHTAGTIAE
ncbi:MAG TPA: ABC transporter ATP-binding protein [Symbiobacteriaceae bacterium]|nr:ABC transporter ATP-binding protein [Symbiobacteriaceae bacterium]